MNSLFAGRETSESSVTTYVTIRAGVVSAVTSACNQSRALGIVTEQIPSGILCV
jgi:hypothetical protein